jgi:hypothetical protein
MKITVTWQLLNSCKGASRLVREGAGALDRAAGKGDVDMCTQLFDQDAEIYAGDSCGETLLGYVAWYGRLIQRASGGCGFACGGGSERLDC